MATYLNQQFSFEELRWASIKPPKAHLAKKSNRTYDAQGSFQGIPVKSLLPLETLLYRLVNLVDGNYYASPWWMPRDTFAELLDDASKSATASGRLFRNYAAQYLSLPSGDNQLSIVEIELTSNVYAWIGNTSPLFHRPGGMAQVFLPNLANRGNPRISSHARVSNTFWLKF